MFTPCRRPLRRTLCRIAQLSLFCASTLLADAAIAQSLAPSSSESRISPILQEHCLDCHSGPDAEGEVRLDELVDVNVQNAALWKTVWEQVALKQMPPREKGDYDYEIDALDRHHFSLWITEQLAQTMQGKGGFNAHLHPTKGNHLDHALLFGEVQADLDPPSTPARIWRVHPQEHLTRLSALINQEPDYDPQRPGLRARGDFIGPNLDGEVKVYYGLDRVIGWVGGTAAYAAAITGFPPVLTLDNHHGLKDYANLYSVNGAEATQIARHAEDILRFMAYGPNAKPYQFANKVSEIDEKYKHGDLRGLAESLFYAHEVRRPLTPVYDVLKDEKPSQEKQVAAIQFLFQALTGRPATPAEQSTYHEILLQAMNDLGHQEGTILGLTPIFLDRNALFRSELANYGEPDAYGRVMLQDHELALALNAAFCYLPPDAQLQKAATEGNLRTRDDARREVQRLLADDSIRKPRLLQFFREYFEYDVASTICKDNQAMLKAGGTNRAQDYFRAMVSQTAHTDRLVELILAEDKDVLAELLTTNRVVVDPKQDAPYFGEYLNDKPPKRDPDAKKKRGPQRRVTIALAEFEKGQPIHVRVARVVKPGRTGRQLTTLPSDQRKGILTHPSWLVSHSDAMDNHAIHRGKWIRERLLGDAVPDVPITVDAMLPEEPKETLRHRMRVTQADYCWKCHQKMDPLGLPFESYNHLGLYRKIEQGKPVDSRGEIIDSGEPELDGDVGNAFELIDKLAQSERVKQVFVRHAFRFWMGRNETLNDAPVLQDAYQAYETSGGSMKALLESLMTSDAFLYRKVER